MSSRQTERDLLAENARLHDRIKGMEDVLQSEQHWLHVLGFVRREIELFTILLRDGMLTREKAHALYRASSLPPPSDSLLWAHVSRMRSKLSPHGIVIANAKGVGWYLPSASQEKVDRLRAGIVTAQPEGG